MGCVFWPRNAASQAGGRRQKRTTEAKITETPMRAMAGEGIQAAGLPVPVVVSVCWRKLRAAVVFGGCSGVGREVGRNRGKK